MNNVIRNEIRIILEQLGELEKKCNCTAEQMLIQDARISLVRADYYDFHVNPKKKFIKPKTRFNYECKHF